MKIEEKDSRTFYRFLLQCYRAGDKWVAWDVYKGPVAPKDLMTFKYIEAANKFCDIHSGEVGDEFYHFEFMPIFNVLKSLSGAIGFSQNTANIQKLEEQIRYYNIDLYGIDQSLVSLLSEGIFLPITICQQIPRIDIVSYVVIEHHYPQEMACRFCHSSINHGNYSNYQDAKACFDQLVEKFNKPGELSPEIKIIGKIKGQELALNYEDFPLHGTGVLFEMANASWNTGEKRYEVEMNNEPDQPVDLYQHKMAKFNCRKSAIEFYDGALRAVLPDTRVDYMSFDNISTRPVKITDSLQRAI